MESLRNVQVTIKSYVAGARSMASLEEALAEESVVLAATPDRQASLLVGDAWRLVSEVGYGHRSEESAKAELRKLLVMAERPIAAIGPSVDSIKAPSGR